MYLKQQKSKLCSVNGVEDSLDSVRLRALGSGWLTRALVSGASQANVTTGEGHERGE